MSEGKCCCGKGKGLCPVSLGLAMGVTGALAVLIWSIWVMYYGMPPMMAAANIPAPTWGSSGMHALVILIKGFLFGFFLALFYDLFRCCCKARCCRKSEGSCSCGCGCKSCSTPAVKS